MSLYHIDQHYQDDHPFQHHNDHPDYEDMCVCFVKVISWRLRLYRQRAPIGRIGANRASTNHSSAGDWQFGQSRLGWSEPHVETIQRQWSNLPFCICSVIPSVFVPSSCLYLSHCSWIGWSYQERSSQGCIFSPTTVTGGARKKNRRHWQKTKTRRLCLVVF